MEWALVYTKQTQKDAKKLSAGGLKNMAQLLLAILREDPFQDLPRFEKLVGDLSGAYFRRITIQHRIVYCVIDDQKTVKILHL